MDTDLDTLATALYVTCDDLLTKFPEHAPARPPVGLAPHITDAELITLAVMSALLGYRSERRWLRHVHTDLAQAFPYVPKQSGYNKRLRKLAGTIAWLVVELGSRTRIGDDDVWVVDSTPVECGRSRETAHRSDLAGWAEYGYCASHSRFFWGLRLHLVCTLHGLVIGWALTGAKADERLVAEQILAGIPVGRAGGGHQQILIGDKNYFGRMFEADLDQAGVELLRPARKGEPPRPGARFFKPLRQTIESTNDTLKGQLDLEAHGGHTPLGMCVRIATRILAMNAAIWHNDLLGQTIHRSLIAYEH